MCFWKVTALCAELRRQSPWMDECHCISCHLVPWWYYTTHRITAGQKHFFKHISDQETPVWWLWRQHCWGELQHLLRNLYALVAISKGMWAVKLCTNKILQVFTGGASYLWLTCIMAVKRVVMFGVSYQLLTSYDSLYHGALTCLSTRIIPTYLSANIQLVSGHGRRRRHLRLSSYRTLAVLRTRTALGDRSFAVVGPRVWNSLPATIRQITSYRQFRQHLKTHLFRA